MKDFLKRLRSVIKKLFLVRKLKREKISKLEMSAQRKKRFLALALIILGIISLELWVNHTKYLDQYSEMKAGFTEGARSVKNHQALKSDINYGDAATSHPTVVDVDDFRLPEAQRDSDKFEQKLKNFTESNKAVVDSKLLDAIASTQD